MRALADWCGGPARLDGGAFGKMERVMAEVFAEGVVRRDGSVFCLVDCGLWIVEECGFFTFWCGMAWNVC